MFLDIIIHYSFLYAVNLKAFLELKKKGQSFTYDSDELKTTSINAKSNLAAKRSLKLAKRTQNSALSK